MILMRVFLAVGLCLLPHTVSRAQTTDLERRVDAYVSSEMARQHIPGLAISIVRDGKPVLIKGYGRATLEHDVAVTGDTVFQLGSVGKQFTAALVMRLAEQGKIRLDAPISTYLGDLSEYWRSITVRHLLAHSSGLRNYEDLSDKVSINPRGDYTEADLVKLFAPVPLEFQPGTDVNYSNTGYLMLGIIISRATGRFWGDVMQDELLKPLGMTSTRVINEAAIIRNRASGYQLVDGKVVNQDWISPSLNRTGDGSLYTTANDMARWSIALLGHPVLSRASLDRSWTVDRMIDGSQPLEKFGYGWVVKDLRGSAVVEHSGQWQGFQAGIVHHIAPKLTVVVLSNSAWAPVTPIARNIISLVDPSLQNYRQIDDTRKDLTKNAKAFVDALAAKAVPLKSYVSKAAAAGFSTRVARLHEIVVTGGVVNEFALVERQKTGNAYRSRYMMLPHGIVELWQNSRGTITDVRFVEQ
jgi:CubicO group peptidase (beta-lactamase class C family)